MERRSDPASGTHGQDDSQKNIGEFKTEGEKRFYRFLEAAAKPDSKFTIWYLPNIEWREPDFILFCEEVGLIIFEVKDWELHQIQEATLRSFVLAMGREKRRKTALISASPKSPSTAAWPCTALCSP
jgi:hypothetical protein